MPNKKRHADDWLNSPWSPATVGPPSPKFRREVEEWSSHMDRGTAKYGANHRAHKEHNESSGDAVRDLFQGHHRVVDGIDRTMNKFGKSQKAVEKKYKRWLF